MLSVKNVFFSYSGLLAIDPTPFDVKSEVLFFEHDDSLVPGAVVFLSFAGDV